MITLGAVLPPLDFVQNSFYVDVGIRCKPICSYMKQDNICRVGIQPRIYTIIISCSGLAPCDVTRFPTPVPFVIKVER